MDGKPSWAVLGKRESERGKTVGDLSRVGSGRVGSVWVGVRKCRAGFPEEEEEEEKKDGSAQRISRRGNGGRHV